MPSRTRIEQLGIERGRAEGQIIRGQANLLRILDLRFEEIPEELEKQIGRIQDLEILGTLLVRAVTVQSPEAFESLARQSSEQSEEE